MTGTMFKFAVRVEKHGIQMTKLKYRNDVLCAMGMEGISSGAAGMGCAGVHMNRSFSGTKDNTFCGWSFSIEEVV